jgi:N-acetyl-anhydromuramyl-L-alanine amidase AmpD
VHFEFETDRFPIVKAKFFKPVTAQRRVRVIVIHSMEAPEKGETAENVAHFFAVTQSPASAHLCIDNNSIVQCVMDNDIAFAAPGVNSDGIQLELAGFARQTRAEWLDPYSVLVLENAANAAAQYCLKYGIPVKHLTDQQLEAGEKGLIGHVQATRVYKKSTHTDPGDGFPWDHFLGRVEHHRTERLKKAPPARVVEPA